MRCLVVWVRADWGSVVVGLQLYCAGVKGWCSRVCETVFGADEGDDLGRDVKWACLGLAYLLVIVVQQPSASLYAYIALIEPGAWPILRTTRHPQLQPPHSCASSSVVIIFRHENRQTNHKATISYGSTERSSPSVVLFSRARPRARATAHRKRARCGTRGCSPYTDLRLSPDLETD